MIVDFCKMNGECQVFWGLFEFRLVTVAARAALRCVEHRLRQPLADAVQGVLAAPFDLLPPTPQRGQQLARLFLVVAAFGLLLRTIGLLRRPGLRCARR